MKAFVAAILATVAIAGGAWYGLTQLGWSAAERNAAESVRLGD